MKILVVGANGMAGHMITKYLKDKKYQIDTFARNDADYVLDIENLQQTQEFFIKKSQKYDFIINCIGLLVRESIDRPDRACLINSWFPHFLEYITSTLNTKIIHLSTDCVFDGKKGNYAEDDIHTELNAYGKSKSLGEIINSKDITFRMSIIGPELKSNGTGLFNWLCNKSDKTIQGWNNAFWNGITTLELAKAIEHYIKNPNINGVYHLVSKNNISKFELLKLINKIFQLNKNIQEVEHTKFIDKTLINTRNDFNFYVKNYDDMLKEIKEYMEKNG